MTQSLDEISPAHRDTTAAQLEALYGTPAPRSLIKEIDYISGHYRAFIEAAPFVVVATSGPEGLDCSPRGDTPGFIRVLDEKTLLIPDRRGNNRIDTLRNLVVDPRISLLFLIPGVGETLRINGRAEIVTDPAVGSTSNARRPWCARTCGARRPKSRAPVCPAPARFSTRLPRARSTAAPTTAPTPSA